MTTAREEKVKLFVKEYLISSDMVLAAEKVSKSRDRKNLQVIGRAYLKMPDVQDAIEEANTFTLDRDGIAKALSDILTGSATVDQKIKASTALEKLTRYDEGDSADGFQDDFERFLHEYGDVLEEFMNTDGSSKKFNETFRPRVDKDGEITFHLKKNLSHLERRQAMMVLLRYLISQSVFS